MDHAEDTALQSTSILLVMIPEYYNTSASTEERKGTKNNIDVSKKRRR
jgi:hypothetical protein